MTGMFDGVVSYGPRVPYFAWRPVNTRDAGWVWLRRITRWRVYMDVYGAPGPFWEYYRYLAPTPTPKEQP